MTTLQAITLALAVLGAVLGLVNTWHSLDKSRVKLRVLPAHAIAVGSANPALNFCIEVTNLSVFPVTVSDVGVHYRGTNRRGSIVQPILLDGGSWPRRLEPRSSVTVYGRRPESLENRRVKCAFATTQCGVTQTGNSPALKQISAEG
jgi:hypothetical protein